MLVSLRREVRTCASHCEYSLHPYCPAWLIRHVHSILKSKTTKIYMVDRATTGKTFVFVTLTYGSRTANQTDSLYQTVNGLVGNVDWGESLTVVACDFLGLNTCSYNSSPATWLTICCLKSDWQILRDATCISYTFLLSASATLFSFPFMCLISKTNSHKNSNHIAFLAFRVGWLNKYFRRQGMSLT